MCIGIFMNTKDLLDTADKYLLKNYKQPPLILSHGEGCYLYDLEGKKYLDFVGGIAVNSLGVNYPSHTAIIQAQAPKLIHTSNLFYSAPAILLAEKLCKLSKLDRAFFCNSGAEANEGAIKIARKYAKQKKGKDCYKIISFSGAFHGRTMGALAATYKAAYREPFVPLPEGFLHLPLHDEDAIRKAVDSTVAAIIIEPIQGEAGVFPVNPKFIQFLRKITEENDIVLITDQVQCGIGRTGYMFSTELSGVTPDIISLAKGLGGGVPIGACVMKQHIAEVIQPGDHGTTFGGGPLVCAAALEVLNIIEKDKVLENVQDVGEYLKSNLQQLKGIKAIRGVGLMLGLDFEKPMARELVVKARENGLLINATSDETLRFIPPLIISKKEVAEGVAVLRSLI